MRFGLDVPTAGAFADPMVQLKLAREAEQAGWDGFFVWDVLLGEPGGFQPVLDPWVVLSSVAIRTGGLRLGAFVTPVARRRPWILARQAASVDLLSAGRLIFGAGLGFRADEFSLLGEDDEPRVRAEKLDEGLALIDRFWSGEPVHYRGSHYTADGVTLLPRPCQRPRIPVWTAAGWPRRAPLRRAARWDGVYLMTANQQTGSYLTPEEVAEAAAVVAAHRTEAGQFDIALNGELPGGQDRAAALAAYERAGATWWIELSPGTPEEYLDRIRQGPPGTR
jgi:alkanesulfonate monooxygenase SsuD/methylene tetrahydromethanopterin reductase-like flavin-dependent oxidoreductase (luciferase family)